MSWLLILCRTLLVDWLQLNHLTALETVGRKVSTLGLGGRVHIMKMESLLLSVMCWIETKKTVNAHCTGTPMSVPVLCSQSCLSAELWLFLCCIEHTNKQRTYLERQLSEEVKRQSRNRLSLWIFSFTMFSCFYIEEFCQLYLILSVLTKIIYLYMYMWISITHMYIYLYKNAYSWLSKGAIAFPLDSLEQLDN